MSIQEHNESLEAPYISTTREQPIILWEKCIAWDWCIGGDWHSYTVKNSSKPPSRFKRFMMRWLLNIHVRVIE